MNDSGAGPGQAGCPGDYIRAGMPARFESVWGGNPRHRGGEVSAGIRLMR
jgi:hypothetical protein